MISLAISILWLLIGVIVICGVVYLALMVVKIFVGVPPRVEQAVWLIVLILILIAALTMLSGGSIRGMRLGDTGPPFRITSPAIASLSAGAGADHA